MQKKCHSKECKNESTPLKIKLFSPVLVYSGIWIAPLQTCWFARAENSTWRSLTYTYKPIEPWKLLLESGSWIEPGLFWSRKRAGETLAGRFRSFGKARQIVLQFFFFHGIVSSRWDGVRFFRFDFTIHLSLHVCCKSVCKSTLIHRVTRLALDFWSFEWRGRKFLRKLGRIRKPALSPNKMWGKRRGNCSYLFWRERHVQTISVFTFQFAFQQRVILRIRAKIV